MAAGSSVRARAGMTSVRRLAERLAGGPVQHAFERVIPVGDTAVAIDDRHALFQVVHHLAAPMLFLEPRT